MKKLTDEPGGNSSSVTAKAADEQPSLTENNNTTATPIEGVATTSTNQQTPMESTPSTSVTT